MEISEKSKKEIRPLFLRNCCLNTCRASYLICNALYSCPCEQKQLEKQLQKILPRKNSFRISIYRLKKRKLIQLVDGFLVITNAGRWHYVATQLGISVSSLCLLSQAYVVQKRIEKKGYLGCCPLAMFSDMAKYSQSVVWMVRYLRDAGLVYAFHKHTIRIFPDKMLILNNYDSELVSLGKYVADLKYKIDKIVNNDPVVRKSLIKGIECYTKITKIHQINPQNNETLASVAAQ